MRYAIFLLCCLVVSCASYGGNGNQAECYTLADCNPGKECGDLVKCVEGKCDPSQTTNIACEQSCLTDQDCPEGSHCRHESLDKSHCVADGTCMDVSECLHIPHDACVGEFECTNGTCVYKCLDITSCSQDQDCALADKECCCGFRPEDYVAVRKDRLNDWINRPECQGVGCPEIACQVPGNIEAHCRDGQCVVRENQTDDWYACEQDSDCTKVQATCCECQYGVPDIGINKNFEDEYMSELMDFCIRADVWCPGYSACTDHGAVCHQGRCATVHEQCGCPETWDPVCMGANAAGVWATVRNECVADCQGIEWDYHGRCDCMVDCFVADPYCAKNGVTYWCGEVEVECNGQEVEHVGECQ